jgi:hypothetical protein
VALVPKNAKTLGISFAGARAKLETREGLMGKRAPEKYGDKVEQTVQSPDDSAMQQEITYRYIVVCPEDGEMLARTRVRLLESAGSKETLPASGEPPSVLSFPRRSPQRNKRISNSWSERRRRHDG